MLSPARSIGPFFSRGTTSREPTWSATLPVGRAVTESLTGRPDPRRPAHCSRLQYLLNKHRRTAANTCPSIYERAALGRSPYPDRADPPRHHAGSEGKRTPEDGQWCGTLSIESRRHDFIAEHVAPFLVTWWAGIQMAACVGILWRAATGLVRLLHARAASGLDPVFRTEHSVLDCRVLPQGASVQRRIDAPGLRAGIEWPPR